MQLEKQYGLNLNPILYKAGDDDMTKVHSIDSNVKFPDMEHYDMGKASEMTLYLAHCDFYPFRSVKVGKCHVGKSSKNKMPFLQ